MRHTLPTLWLLASCLSGPNPPDDWPARCPDPDAAGVEYKHETWEERGVCAMIDYECTGGTAYLQRAVKEDCGCGCITRAACAREPGCDPDLL